LAPQRARIGHTELHPLGRIPRGLGHPATLSQVNSATDALEILKLVRRIAASHAGTVLLDGESGTGKDLIA
jgi:transcriptional regulator with PAS, ATPase and Fis domain